MEPDRRRDTSPRRDCGAKECAEGDCGENCGGGAGSGSDRVAREETLAGGAGGDEEGNSERRDGGLGRSVERRRDRDESCWRPWGVCESEERSRSPEKKDISNGRSRNGGEDDDEMKDLSDSSTGQVPVLDVDALSAVVVDEEPNFGVGAGLANLGNTCFLNSVLQCLVRTVPLLHGLFMIGHQSPCFSEEFCLICRLREHVQLTFSPVDEFAPYGIVAHLKYFSSDFVRYQQEDAHEFLQCLLNKLEKYPMRPWTPYSVTPSGNLAKQLFGGSLISRLRCNKCNHISCTPEDLIDFSLEINDVNTLDGALDSFTKLEKLDDVMFTCDACNEKVSVEKQFVIDKTPLVTSFHLKRFKNDGITVEKIDKHIEYPLSLNLHPYTISHPQQNADLMYDLYAVIVHDGLSSDSGHYFCYVRSSPSTWHKFDDSMVTRVSESHVLSQEAYILFYAYRGVSWFSNPCEVSSLCAPPKDSPTSVLDKANQSSESDSSTESLSKHDVRINRNKQFTEADGQPACLVPQQVNSEAGVKDSGHGNYSDLPLVLNGKHDEKNEVDMEDSSFNFDMLLNIDDEESTMTAADTNNSSLNLDMPMDEANINRKELVEATRAQTCSTSSLNNEECPASSSLHEAGNCTDKNPIGAGEDPIKTTSCQADPSGSLGETCSVTKKNVIITGVNSTKLTSCQSGLNGSPGRRPLLRKRFAEKPIDDPRKKQILKTLKRTNMPMTRANRFLALLPPSPNKKTKKAPISPVKKHCPRKRLPRKS